MKLLRNFKYTGSFTNVISKLQEIWSFCKGHIRYYIVRATCNFEVAASNIKFMAIPYSILDGPPLCIFKITIYCSHLISNIRFMAFFIFDIRW